MNTGDEGYNFTLYDGDLGLGTTELLHVPPHSIQTYVLPKIDGSPSELHVAVDSSAAAGATTLAAGARDEVAAAHDAPPARGRLFEAAGVPLTALFAVVALLVSRRRFAVDGAVEEEEEEEPEGGAYSEYDEAKR